MENIPEKLQLFLRLIKDQLYLNDSDDNTVVFNAEDLLDDGITISNINQFQVFLKKNKIISDFNFWEGYKENPLPTKKTDKLTFLKPTFWQFLRINMAPPEKDEKIDKFVLEIVSREGFSDFYEKARATNASQDTKKEQLHELLFDSEKSMLKFKGKKILISKKTDKTNGHYILEYIFNDPQRLGEKHYYSEIHEGVGDHAKEYSWRLYQRACADIQEKVRKETPERIEDFLIFNTGETGSVRINPKYLEG